MKTKRSTIYRLRAQSRFRIVVPHATFINGIPLSQVGQAFRLVLLVLWEGNHLYMFVWSRGY